MGADLSNESLQDIAEILANVEHAASDEEADGAVARGLLDHGVMFISAARSLSQGHGQVSERVVQRAEALVLRWLGGAAITDRADEPELRARFAVELMRMNPRLARVAAGAVLRLPEGHLVRDVAHVEVALLEMLRTSGVDYPDLAGSPSPDSMSTALDAVGGLVEHRLLPDEDRLALIEAGLRWIDSDDAGEGQQRPFRLSAAMDLARRSMHARDEGDQEAQRRWLARARSVFQPVLDEAARPGAIDLKDNLVVSFLDRLEREADPEGELRGPSPTDEPDRAASSRIEVDVSALGRDEMAAAAMTADLDSQAAYKKAQYERVVRMLAPYIPWMEECYLTAVADKRIASSGKQFSEVMTRLAFAQAHRGKWGSAIRLLDAVKSKRFRYQAALRSGTSRDEVIALEEALRNRAWEAGDVRATGEVGPESVERTIESRLLEKYRRVRESSPPELADLRVRDLSRHLAADEAVLILGLSHLGLLMALIRRGDKAKPSESWILPESAWQEIVGNMADAERGWIVALQSPSPGRDVRTVLPDLLRCVDAVIGAPLAPSLKKLQVRRLTVVPHYILHLVPFWALPSLDGMQVDVAPSAAHFVDASSPVPFKPKNAMVVSNPTLDLPLSELEGEVVADRLAAIGLDVDHVRARRATREAMEAVVVSPAILHFAGHGRGEAMRPLESSLELHPGKSMASAEGEDYLLLTSGNLEWSAPYGGERSADIPGVGRLTEVASPGTCRVERRLNRFGSGTMAAYFRYVDKEGDAPEIDDERLLAADCEDEPHDERQGLTLDLIDLAKRSQLSQRRARLAAIGRWKAMEQTLARGEPFSVELIRMADLWTAGDILSSRFLSGCRIAFLSTCETAIGQLSNEVDESAGFSAALQLAGVSAVIAPTWPVDTVAALMFAELFYEELTTRMSAAGGGGCIIDLGRIAHEARGTMRRMRNDDAVSRLKRRASCSDDPMTALILEAEAVRMSRKGARPFEHPMDWAAFHALGAKRLVWRGTLVGRLVAAVRSLASAATFRPGGCTG